MANDSSADWDETAPAGTDFINKGDDEIRVLRAGVRERDQKEHVTNASSSAGGEHLQGSAKSFYQASAPTLRPDASTSLDSDDAGRLFVDSDDKIPYVWGGAAFQKLVAGQVAANAVELGDVQANAINARNLNLDVVNPLAGLVQETDGSLSVCVKETIEIDSGCLRVLPGSLTSTDMASGSGFLNGWAKIEDVKADGVEGGASVASTWTTRVLTTLTNPDSIVTSLASNQFVLPAGTYHVKWSSPGYGIRGHQTRLRNITDIATESLGSSEKSDNSDPTTCRSFGVDKFTIAGAKTFEIQHWAESLKATDGFGKAASSGEGEVYTQVELWKEL